MWRIMPQAAGRGNPEGETAHGREIAVPVRRPDPSPARGEEDAGVGVDREDVPRLQRGEAAGRGAASFRTDAEARRHGGALPDRRADPRGARRIVYRPAAK